MITRVDDITNEEQLKAFMAKLHTIRDSYDEAHWRFYLIPNYSKEESVLILKVNHALMDGQGIAWFVKLVAGDNDDISGLPGMKPMGMLTWIFLHLMGPFLLLYGIFFAPKATGNAINTGEPITGEKHGAISRDLSIAEIKKAAKDKKCTVNDFMTSVLVVSLEEYFRRNPGIYKTDAPIPKEIAIGMPFSVRERTPLDQLKFTNYFSAIMLGFPITSNFDESIKNVKKVIDGVKRSFVRPFFGLFLMKFVTSIMMFGVVESLGDEAAKNPHPE